MIKYFGFVSLEDWISTLLRPDVLLVNVVLSSLVAWIENLIGFGPTQLVLFVLLLSLEFSSGILASLLKDVPIQSHRMKRFLFNLLAYLIILAYFKTMAQNYPIDSTEHTTWMYAHSVSLFVISGIYLVSIRENLEVIRGKKLKGLFKNLFKHED